MSVGLVIASAALAAWLYLTARRGGFWRASVRVEQDPAPRPVSWPAVVAVVPARDEAEVIGASLASLLDQDYPGAFDAILVDDQSRDGTAALARQAAAAADRLTVISGRYSPPGWGGKVWAMQQGLDCVRRLRRPPRYVLFTDADIVFDRATLRQLVARAEADELVLTSLMVKLRCESVAERLFIPAFIFFFQMIYPFAWVNRPRHRMAAAAGGCMLARFSALTAAGGLEAIRGALIDDCALARRMKAVGPIWVGLTDRVHSLRRYPQVTDIRRMVARTAYDQLRYSPLLLAGTIAGMALTYLAPPLITLFGTGWAQLLAAAAWALMILAFQPTLRFYRLSPWRALALPGVALAYMAFTLDSAYQHSRGRGGLWKGRVHANVSGLR
ncbi:MAG: glycosyltransferase [Xanthobacteraceae bacterium]|jgi:hopene-associated glycosyltransferase HpnB